MSNEILFMVGAAAMVAVSMLFLLPPLLGRSREVGIARRENNLAIFQQRREELKQDLQQEEINEAQFEQAEADLKRELLADLEGDEQSAESSGGAGRLGALITLVFVPLISISLYNYLGKPEAINSVSVQRGEQQTDQSREAFAQSVEKLEQKLLQNPNNLEGWMMLAKSYRYLGEEQKVVDTYEKALQQTGNESNASLLLEYGEALAEQNRGEWQGKPLEQLHRALEADPTHNDALWFAGNIYFDLGEYGQALGYWEKLSKLIPTDDAEIVSMVNQAANEAQKKLGYPNHPCNIEGFGFTRPSAQYRDFTAGYSFCLCQGDRAKRATTGSTTSDSRRSSCYGNTG